MKAWILIAFYLWKDIWRRWLETPGGLLSRLLVAFLLGLLMLLLHAAFSLSARSLEEKIGRLGVRTLLVTRTVSSQDLEAGAVDLPLVLAPLAGEGELLVLRQLGVVAEDDSGQPCGVAVFDEAMLTALAPGFAPLGRRLAYLVTDELPPAMPVRVDVDGVLMDCVTASPPGWLAALGSRGRLLLMPQSVAEPWLDRGYLEMLLFLGDDDGAALPDLVAAVRNILRLDGIQNVQMTSPEGLLAELDELRGAQRRWQGGFGVFGGLAVALVFGSIAVLEYRQNRYIVALLRSFGTPPVLLLARYLVEALILVAAAAWLARFAATAAHVPLFSRAGFEPGLLDLNLIHPYAWPELWRQWRWLGLGGLLSVVPVAFALRTPVGKVLG